MPRKVVMARQRMGVYRYNWRPPKRKKWVGTVVVVVASSSRRRQSWIV